MLALYGCSAQTVYPGVLVEHIDGHQVESLLLANPHSKAVVIFENGARGTINKWDKVLAEVSKEATTFAYNRPGYANSEAASSPRDGHTIVAELHSLLKYKNLKPPYLLVGHSLGGLYVQLFAKTYPDEVEGIVLVDSLYPRIIKRPEDFPLATRIAKKLFFSSSVQQEVDRIYDTGEAILALPAIDSKPMIRLFNVPTTASAVAVDFGTIIEDPKARDLVEHLYPNARKVIVDSAHEIQTENPEFVIAAIHELLRAKTALALQK